jgi:hypothetical protein
MIHETPGLAWPCMRKDAFDQFPRMSRRSYGTRSNHKRASICHVGERRCMDVHPTRRSYGQEGGKGALVFAMSDGEVVG